MQLLDSLEAPPGLDAQPLEQRLLLLGRNRDAQLAGQQEVVLRNAVQRLRRGLAGQAIVNGRAQRVDIGPRPLPLLLVLLQRRVPVLEGDGHGLGTMGRLAGTPKVQQAHPPAFQHEVVRRNVPVDQPRLVHMGQRLEQRLQHDEQLVRRNAAAPLFHQIAEGCPLDVLHDDIGGVVHLEKVPHAHNHLLLVHPRHDLRFAEEFLLASFKAAGRRADKAGYRQRCGGVAGGAIHRIVFLDRHLELQPQVAPDIGDAKAAFAQHPPHQIPVHQHCARRQMVRRWDVIPRRQLAGGAAFARRHGRHAVRAKMFFQCFHLFSSSPTVYSIIPDLPAFVHLFFGKL